MPNYTIEELLGKKEEENKPTNYTMEELLGKKEEQSIEQPKPSMQQLDDTASDRETPSFFEGPASMYPAKLAFNLLRDKTPEEKSDLARVAINVPVGTASLIYDIVDAAQSQFTDKEWGDAPFDNFVRKTALASGISKETVNRVLDDDGKIKPVETTLGTAAEVGSWISGYAGIKKLLGQSDNVFKEGLKTTGASLITAQALSDPSYNSGNVLEELLNDSESYKDGNLMTVAQALSADDDDSVAMQRLKLMGEEPLFIALGFTGTKSFQALGWASTQSKKLFNKKLSELTPKEREKLTVSFLEDAKTRIKLTEDTPLRIRTNRVEEETVLVPLEPQSTWAKGVAYIAQQGKRYFTSKGQFTDNAFVASKAAEVGQRQAASRAEFVASSLQRSLDDITDATESEEVSRRVMDSLNSDTSFLEGVANEDRVKTFANQFNLPEKVAAPTLEARKLIDEMTGKFDNVRMDKSLKEALGNNIGQYLRRSYRMYEDPAYEPDNVLINNAIDYFTNLKISEGVESPEAARNAARQVVSQITEMNWGDSSNHFTNIRSLNRKIFTKRKDDEELPKVVRELLGEIEEPAESVLLSITKASKFYENLKFYNTFENLGMKGNYVFTNKSLPTPFADDAANLKFQQENFIKITGTNSSLDGKYTTPQMNSALMQREEHFSRLADIPLYKVFLAGKGATQAAKTVYSWTTHIRNISGGAQFALANGMMPINLEVDAVGTILAGVRKKGDEALIEKYDEYLGLGIINTSVKINEFRKLLDTGFQGYGKGGSKVVKAAAESLPGKALKKVQSVAEEVYMGVDDMYKIHGYETELALLKEAFPNTSEKILREEAADIIKNTFPTYDRVPPGVKALRELPLGNFISFPSEIIRTSGNILRRASREITSGNDVLKTRGLKRLAGFTASMTGWSAASYGSAYALGWTDDQKEGAEVLAETPWSKYSNRVFTTIDDKFVSMDTQFLDSYSMIKEPLNAFVSEIQDGSLKGKDLDDKILGASQETLKTIMSPYVSESMLTDLLLDIGVAAVTDGTTREGKPYFTEAQTKTDSAKAVLTDAIGTFAPGVLDTIFNLKDAINETPLRGGETKRTKDTQLELLKVSLGVNFTKFDPENNLYFAGRSYKSADRKVGNLYSDWTKPSEQLLKEHFNIEKARFENQQELYRKYQAAVKFYGPSNMSIPIKALRRGGVSRSEMMHIQSGIFMPRKLTKNSLVNAFKKTPYASGEDLISKRLQEQMRRMSYSRLDEPLEEQVEARLRKNKGGVVEDVPNTSKEPDQRIDKMTGRPYDQQAGAAFTDQEDRQDPLQRMGFGMGGKASKDPRKEAFIRRLQLNVGGYLIESGDTLSGIARKTGSTLEELQELNKIEDVDKIYAGKTLKVPEYLKSKEEVSLDEEDQQQFSDDVAVALVEKVFSPDDLETELLETRERATTVVKSKIPEKPSEDFVPVGKARQYDFSGLSRYGNDSRAATTSEESRKTTFYEKLNAARAPADYVMELAKDWYDTRQDVNRRYEAGEITEIERGVWNVAGHIKTATTPLVDLLGAVASGTTKFLGVDDELAEVGKAVSETEAAKSLIELMQENPRSARNIESVAQIIGVGASLKVFERGFNRIAEGVTTKQEGFYDSGRTALGKMFIVGKDFVKKVPSAGLDAVVPWRSRARNTAGASTIKIADELNEAIGSADRFASMLTARYIRWQSREKNTGILDDVNSPVALANEYKFLDSWNEAEVRKQIFEDISNGGNLGLRVPDAIQDIASAHIKKVWGTGNKGIKESNTGVVIKRPDGPQSLGNEALNNGSRNTSSVIREILSKGGTGKNIIGKDGVEIKGTTYTSSTDKMLKFLNDRSRKVIEDKAVAAYKAISTKGTDGYLIPSKRPFKNQAQAKEAALKEAGYKPMKSANEMSSQDFKDYLTFKKIDFEEGPDDFVIIRGSHVSESKEIGGVNDFIAIDTKKGDVFSMISDKHDIGKDIDPIGGRSLLTVQPMVSRNFKTLEIPKYRPRDIAAERAAARKLAEKTGVPLRATQESSLGYIKNTSTPRNAQGGRNKPVEYMEDVLRDVSNSKKFTGKDVKDSIRRTSLLSSSQNVYRDTSENAPEVYRDKINVLTALRDLTIYKDEERISGI